MSVLLKPHKPQKYTVDGVKFFKKHLEKINYDSIVTDHPITASEISVFMLLHLHTDEMGQIRSLTKDSKVSDRKRLCISNLSTEHELNYETVKKAFDSLIKRKYIAEIYTTEGIHYEIVDYAKFNQQMDSPLSNEKLNYFRIPFALFQEKIFGPLIKQRYHKGPILLLKLCEYFTRQLGTNRKYVEDIHVVKDIRTMSYLKETLNTNAKRVRNFLSIIQNIFLFKPIKEVVKNPSQDRQARRRTFVQIYIEKFSFTSNRACFVRNEEVNEKKSFARMKKEMAARIKNAKIPVKWRNMMDIQKSLSRIARISTHFHIVGKAQDLIDYTVFKVADTLEQLHIEGALSSIKNLGGFVNSRFSNAVNDFTKLLSEGERIEIMTKYHQTYGYYPEFISK